MQSQLDLKNKTLEEDFKGVLHDIDEGITDEDEYIVHDLSQVLKEMEEEDQVKALRFINIKFKNRSFLQLGNFFLDLQEQQLEQINVNEDFKVLYEQLKGQNNYIELINMMQYQKFCDQNQISIHIQENITILAKLGSKILKILYINDSQKQNDQTHQFELLRTLLELIYDGLNEQEEQNKIEFVIGSLLIDQIDEFNFYLENTAQLNSQVFEDFILCVQKYQMKIIAKQDDPGIKLLNKDLQFLFTLFTADVRKSKQTLDFQLQQYFEIYGSNLTFENICNQLELFLLIEADLQFCYFSVVWYLWTQYVCQPDFLKDLQIHEVKRDKQDESKRFLLYQRYFTTVKKGKNDRLFEYFLQKAILFIYQMNNSQELKKCQEKQMLLEAQQIEQYKDLNSFEDLIFIGEEKFSSLWVVTHKQKWQQLSLDQIRCSILKQIIKFMWSNSIEKNLQTALRIFIQVKRLTLDLCAEIIESFFPEQSFSFKTGFLCIVSSMKNLNRVCLQSLIKCFKIQKSYIGGEKLIEFSQILENKNRSLDEIKFFSKQSQKEWIIICQFFENQSLIKFVREVLEQYLNTQSFHKKQIYCLILLSQMLPHIIVEGDQGLQCLKTLFSIIDHSDLHKILTQNTVEQIPDFNVVSQTLALLYKIYDDLIQELETKKQVFCNLKYFLANKIYRSELIYKLKLMNQSNEFITLIIQAFYLKSLGNIMELEQCCLKIFNSDEKLYQDCFEQEQYLDDISLTPQFLKIKQLYYQYPQKMQIKLERFNISLAELNQESQQILIEDWINSTKDEEKFMNLVPIYFNIIKRGENPSFFLDTIDLKKPKKCLEHFNMKTLFQLLFNNSNDELKVMLLKFRSKFHSIPFIYKNIQERLDCENSLFVLNHLLFYVFPNCYTIINFSLSPRNNKIGKTYLINQIFYEDAKPFQICDTSELNKNTMDIMFDFCFNGSRELAIADSHGVIPLQILSKILQLFQLWIVQMETEEELEQTFQNVKTFQQTIDTYQPTICFLVRDSQQQLQQKYESLIREIKSNNIVIHQMKNLFDKNLNEQGQKNEINNVQKLILDKLKTIISRGQKVNKNLFLEIVKNYELNYVEISQKMWAQERILIAIEKEMENFITKPDGFYNKEAFPLRRYGKQISQFIDKMDDQQITQNLKQQDKFNEETTIIQGKTKILELFCSIFEEEDFYILYLQLIDNIRKFNEEQSKELQDLHQKQIENIIQKKKEKNQLQKNNLANEKQIEQIKQEIDELKKDCLKIQANIFFKNIGIEMFWREIISQQEIFQPSQLDIKPAEVFFKLIEKGEPFEFLDGNELKINQKFLQIIFDKLEKKGQERILILSVLGPQSSGKSTILNKIFGCHFWTSVGRCTKGIYLQLLKVHNKELFQNQFDYIMLLDTEGLQSPTQQDADFDKSIALFTLLISDIIIINVKGDITQQFKNLVEMCIYTLGQMATNFQSVKQLSWCFNQNNDTNNLDPFLTQIKGILDNLSQDANKEEKDDQKIDYSEILQINKKNIKILGFSSYEKAWKKAQEQDFKDCKQLLTNETFSSEAYAYGIQIITNFVQQFNSQKDQDQLSDINKFISNIAGNWENIKRLPDLLEFTELIQQQQNNTMKQEYERIKDALAKKLNFENEIRIEIEKEIGDQQQEKTDQYFQEMQKKYENTYILKVTKSHEEASNHLNAVRSQNQLSKKVTTKFQKQLEQFILGKQNDCKTCIFDSIKEKQIFHQKTQRISQINERALQIIQDSNKLEYIQQNPHEIQSEFDTVWNKTIQDGEQQHNQIFQEFQTNQYNQMMSINTKYQLSTEHAKDYKQFIMAINKDEHCDQKEKENIFEMFSKELKQQQFMVLEKTAKYSRYLDIFSSTAERKLSTASDLDLVDIRKFYQYQVELKYISKSEIENYLKNLILTDLKEVLVKCQKQRRYTSFHDFFIIFNVLDAKYNVETQELIFDLFKSNQVYQWYKSDELTLLTETFYKSVIFDKSKKTQINNIEILQKSFEYYPQLMKKLFKTKEIFQSKEDYNQFKEKLFENIVVFWETITIIPNNPQEKFFQFILNPQEANSGFKSLIPQIPEQFSKLMEAQQGFKKLYFGIYDFIQKQCNQTIYKTDATNDIIQSDDEISSFNNNFQINIMNNVEKQLATFNNEFSNYGVVLNQLGERCIYYYSVLLIWRFGCFKKWQVLDRHQKKVEKDKQDLFEKFKNRILGDWKNQSKLQAQTLMLTMQKEIENHFLPEEKKVLQQIILKRKMTSFQLISRLDQELLLNYNQIQPDDKTNQNVLNYVQNQLTYIQNYAQDYIVNLQSELQNQIKKNNPSLKQKILKIIELIEFNATVIYTQLQQQQEVLYIKDYFQSEQQKDREEYYEYLIYKIVFDCLLGKKNGEINQIKNEYKTIFQQTFKPISVEIKDHTIYNQDRKISQFKSYIEELCYQFQKIKQTVKESFSFNLSQFNLSKDLEDLKLEMIGCIFQCPMCNRKCDLKNHDENQKHECKNGHQLRGMNSILVESIPSLFTCEEISPIQEIRDQQSKNVCLWSEIIKRYPEWEFRSKSDKDHSENLKKMIRIWNGGVGRLICNLIKENLKISVYFREKHEQCQSQEKNHYIFMIDSSNFISSQNWGNAEKAVKKCIKCLENNENAKISVLTFDEIVKIRFDLKSAKGSSTKFSYIWYRSGKLDLNLAFHAFNSQVQKYTDQKFSRIILFMYTSGIAQYPEAAIDEFSKLDEELRNSITILIATEDSSSATLTQIIDEFKKKQLCSEQFLLPSMPSEKIVNDWRDKVFWSKKLC